MPILDDAPTMRDVLKAMVYQFAYRRSTNGRLSLYTGGLSALEDAFEALGWPDPKPYPEGECDEPNCHREVTCGTPTAQGYRHTCGKHRPKET
ncbi:MAG: hypothetical protein HY323_07055 [Betaproteobacteria bacterium]|nr:hypothetical protein [Betaproteobacteria bacterium]